ncbi:MAG TPA: hypothetical protein PKX93_10495 [bacterium]|nr:hypothetical protein [bacterium]HOL67872.1 hypothetical protein [bacterium]HPP12047.1 hypothetical protein [bacterium]
MASEFEAIYQEKLVGKLLTRVIRLPGEKEVFRQGLLKAGGIAPLIFAAVAPGGYLKRVCGEKFPHLQPSF